MKWTGERVVPDDMHEAVDTYQQHLVRYVWALEFAAGKDVLDAACGTGYGTALLGGVAKLATGYDISEQAVRYANTIYDHTLYRVVDLENPVNTNPRELVVSFETIEHLNDPEKFLEWCKQTAPEVIGSIPINCPTEFHKHVWNAEQIIEILHKHFRFVEVWYQDEMNIVKVEADWAVPNHGMILFRGLR